jgi:IclR family transcriptional regulator, acetate operon repressor
MAKEVEKAASEPGPPASTPDRYFSRAIGNALRILELLKDSPTSLSLAEIARQVALPKSSVFRILHTLEIAAYVQRLEGERFSLSPGAGVPLNQVVKRVVTASESWMKHLSQEFRETISVACLHENHIEVAAVIDSPQRVAMGNVVGDLIPPHASSLGKCIAAHQPDVRRARLLRSFGLVRFTAKTIVEEVVLCKEFDLVKTHGYALDLEESVLGGCCVSAPIFARTREAVAAISISTPKIRFTDQERFTVAVKDAANAISGELSGH